MHKQFYKKNLKIPKTKFTCLGPVLQSDKGTKIKEWILIKNEWTIVYNELYRKQINKNDNFIMCASPIVETTNHQLNETYYLQPGW